MANRSISLSLDERLLAQLDAQGANRSALVSEALQLWLAIWGRLKTMPSPWAIAPSATASPGLFW